MKRNKQKEENEEEEEQISLSKTTNIIVCLIVFIAIVFKLPPLANGILFAFMPIVIGFDVLRQRSAQKEGVIWV